MIRKIILKWCFKKVLKYLDKYIIFYSIYPKYDWHGLSEIRYFLKKFIEEKRIY